MSPDEIGDARIRPNVPSDQWLGVPLDIRPTSCLASPAGRLVLNLVAVARLTGYSARFNRSHETERSRPALQGGSQDELVFGLQTNALHSFGIRSGLDVLHRRLLAS